VLIEVFDVFYILYDLIALETIILTVY